MKKILLSLLLIPIAGFSQNVTSFGFSGTTAEMFAAGWQQTNQSAPLGQATWSVASFTAPLAAPIFGSGNVNTVPVGQAGGNNSFAIINFNSTTGAGTISNWLISPNVTVQNGDVVTFYSRKGTDGTTAGADFPDRLELRMSSAATTVLPVGASDVGSFTTLGVTINPTLVSGFVYPQTWTQYTYTVSGLAAPVAVKFGFRYFVTNGGPSGSNSDIIGIDTFSVNRTLATENFAKSNFTISPNPATDVLNISNLNGLEILSVKITDINGRVVKQINSSIEVINVSELSTGVYFLNVNTTEGSGMTKFIKN
jgi:hypothetical protein